MAADEFSAMPGHNGSAGLADSTAANAASEQALRRGRLFYVVGASGAGKDSIIAACRNRLEPRHRCLVAHRYITRIPEASGENHVWLNENEFRHRLALGSFAMYWSANGLQYGVGKEIDQWLDNGCHVIVNGSRAYLSEALRRYADALIPVHIVVDPGLLRARLLARGREDAGEIEQRIRRATDYGRIECDRTRIVHNNGAIEQAATDLLELLDQAQENSPAGIY